MLGNCSTTELCCSPIFLFTFETVSHDVTQATAEVTLYSRLAVLVPQPPEELGIQCIYFPKWPVVCGTTAVGGLFEIMVLHSYCTLNFATIKQKNPFA